MPLPTGAAFVDLKATMRYRVTSVAALAVMLLVGGSAHAACDTSITSGPPTYTASTNATFSFTASGCSHGVLSCKLDGGTWATCTSPKAFSGLAVGQHAFRVKYTNGFAATRTWTIDTVAPNTTIPTSPPSPTGNPVLSFTFSATQTVLRYECSLDSAAYVTCPTPYSVGPVAAGAHELRVRAVDLAGNVDATPAFSDVTVSAAPCP